MKDYKADAKYYRECADKQHKVSTRWMNCANDLQKKLDEAMARLQMIANAQWYSGEVSATDDGHQRARKTAVSGIAKIARMQERKF